MRYAFGILFILFLSKSAFSQEQDSTFTMEEFFEIVEKHHPMAERAELQTARGEANLLMSRGAFDPKAFADISQKYFRQQEYYSLINGGLKIPTWFGVELVGGYEENEGQYLNPEDNTPAAGLYYAGISVPVGQGLFIDERRAQLNQAKIYQEASRAERAFMLNDLFYKAGSAYWDWFIAWHQVDVYREAYSKARERRDAVQGGAELGDRPLIDTLEASIQVQNRLLALREAELQLANSRAQIEAFLWAEGTIPLELSENTAPPEMETLDVAELLENLPDDAQSAIVDHPELTAARLTIDQLEVERRWKAEQLKPTLNLKYNPLTEAIGGDAIDQVSVNNYTWGLEFEMPILLRKERGALQLAEIKLRQSDMKLRDKQANLTYKLRAALNELQTLSGQASTYGQTVSDYRQLVEGERELFAIGESSLFLVNSRELGLISAEVKYIEIFAKQFKAALKVDYAMGSLSENN
ncbi:TolC family protein [Halocola ammonii]